MVSVPVVAVMMVALVTSYSVVNDVCANACDHSYHIHSYDDDNDDDSHDGCGDGSGSDECVRSGPGGDSRNI